MTSPQLTQKRLLAVLPLIFLLAGSSSRPAFASQPNSGGGTGIVVNCATNKATMNGKTITISCGAATPTASGLHLPKMEPCKGRTVSSSGRVSGYACMRGVQCITISGPYKFHMPHCGKGGQTSGKTHGAGCVELSTADFAMLKQMAGQPFKVIGTGGHSGRGPASGRSRR